MNIRLHDARTVALEFPYSPATVARVKALPGAYWSKDLGCWLAPLYLLRRIVDMFPSAKIDRAVVDARLAQWKRWIRQLNRAGVWFCYDTDCATVVPTGPAISPVFEEWTATRSEILSQFLGDQLGPPQRHTPAGGPLGAEAEPSHGDRLIWTGIQNAAKGGDRGARQGKRGEQVEQMNLLD